MSVFDKFEVVGTVVAGKSFSAAENERIRAAARRLLEQHDGNQRVLAEALGVTQPTVSNFLSGKNGAGVTLAKKIAVAVGVGLDALVAPPSVKSGEGSRWRALPWWASVIAEAKKLFPKVSDLAWTRLGNLMGEQPPTKDPVGLGMLASSWDQVSTDDDRAAEIAAAAEAEMAEEDAATDDLLRRRHEAREKGVDPPALPDDPKAAGRPKPPAKPAKRRR